MGKQGGYQFICRRGISRAKPPLCAPTQFVGGLFGLRVAERACLNELLVLAKEKKSSWSTSHAEIRFRRAAAFFSAWGDVPHDALGTVLYMKRLLWFLTFCSETFDTILVEHFTWQFLTGMLITSSGIPNWKWFYSWYPTGPEEPWGLQKNQYQWSVKNYIGRKTKKIVQYKAK